MEKVIPVVVCGGSGTRLWPLSRQSAPKPFIRLAKNSKTLLELTYERARDAFSGDLPLTIGNAEHYFLMRSDFRKAYGRSGASFVLEPFGRNTAAAVGLALAHVELELSGGEDPILFVMAADHLISDFGGFEEASKMAVEEAKDGSCLVILGVEPTSPNPGFGYVKVGASGWVSTFVEKPPEEKAMEMIREGGCFWNAGMVCGRWSAFVREFQRQCVGTLDGARSALVGKWVDDGGLRKYAVSPEPFKGLAPLAFDVAVLEGAEKVKLVSKAMGWSDVGSWDAVSETVPSDEAGNRSNNKAMFKGSADCYVHAAEEKTVVALGLEAVVIIDTEDALLVAGKSHLQEIKDVASKLSKDGHVSAKRHRLVHAPWGSHDSIATADRFKVKRLVVRPGEKLSLQSHMHRSEHWVIVQGVAKVTIDQDVKVVASGESTFIRAGQWHRLENPGRIDLIVVEVQCGEYLEEDDIERREDAYGRLDCCGSKVGGEQ